MSSKDRILASRCVMPLDCIHHMGYGMVGCHQLCFVSNRELLYILSKGAGVRSNSYVIRGDGYE